MACDLCIVEVVWLMLKFRCLASNLCIAEVIGLTALVLSNYAYIPFLASAMPTMHDKPNWSPQELLTLGSARGHHSKHQSRVSPSARTQQPCC